MPVVAALVYGSFGDIQATLALTYRLYDILRSSGLGELSREVQNVLRVLEAFHTNTAALMQYLGTVSFINLSDHAQRIADKISAELQACESLMEKLKDKVASCSGFCARVLWAVSGTQALAAWRAEMEEHRKNVSMYLESLLMCVSVIVT
jgi:hypothetical protein